MQIGVEARDVVTFRGDGVIVNLFEGVQAPTGATGALDDALRGLIRSAIRAGEFTGKAGESLLLHTGGRIPATRVLVVGLGKAERFDLDGVRTVMGGALRTLRRSGCRRVASVIHGTGAGGLDLREAAQAATEGALLGLYTFDRYKAEKEEKRVDRLTLLVRERPQIAPARAGVLIGQTVAEAVTFARDLVNEPSNTLTPQELANRAQAVCKRTRGLSCEILNRRQITRLGMGALLGVAQGSGRDPVLIILRYRGGRGRVPAVGLVGKGITFDSGGISIKPSEGMEQMKGDMAGGAAVVGAMTAIARLRPRVNVAAVVPACENLPDARALKPGDVLRAMNGKTIEVINTDAEGRLILADALCYARQLGCERLVDVATLTGACVVALGRIRTGAFGNDRSWIDQVLAAGVGAGEKIWQMPLDEEYGEQIKSDVAVVKNTGGRPGGAITAAKFLEHFVEKTPWVHLDIAGTADTDREKGYT
ncbi:MAG: leucyl aminopeptidase, partial [Candidatus Methylomirabilales bacterium]